MSQAVSQATFRISGFSFYRPRLMSVLISMVFVSVLALLFVWSRIHAINLEYDISRLEMDTRQQQQQIKELKMESAYLARDERIAQLGAQLGLRVPSPGQVIRVD
jgi:cell division protein FtsL